MNGWLWVYVAFVIKMIGYTFWCLSILATNLKEGDKDLSDERGGMKADERYDNCTYDTMKTS
jgi:hypothetical protein